MPRPSPTRIYHFTRVEHLRSVLEMGLLCDRQAQVGQVLGIEVGNTGIKARRSVRRVPVRPGGVVADYAPFYFAPRSPMMYSIHMGNVPGYTDGADRLVYLATTVEKLLDLGLDPVLTDRNAVLDYTGFVQLREREPAEGFIDWPLMDEQFWFDSESYPDRRERRMAECLVHSAVPWEAFLFIGAHSQTVVDEVGNLIGQEASTPRVALRRQWYF